MRRALIKFAPMKTEDIKIVAFDADDTLWVNERFFREGEDRLCAMLDEYAGPQEVIDHLYRLEMSTINLYGYGIKSYILSMIETAVDISGGEVSPATVKEIIEMGKEQMQRPVELYEGVRETLSELGAKYELVLATKGDLLDQWRKIGKSGLRDHFSHVEIMSDKKQNDYHRLLDRIGCPPQEFLMVGNSLKSDVVPVLEIGGYAIYVPCDNTWAHEEVEVFPEHPNFMQADTIKDVVSLLLR